MPPEPSAVEPQPEPNGPTLKPLVTVPSWRPPVERELRSSSSRHRERDVVSVSRSPKPSPKRSPKQTPPSKLTVADQDGAQPACPICLDDLVEPQMLGCGHLYCAKCIATHASVQRAANRPVNCPCCLRPVAPAELPTEVHAEAAETAASSSTVEAPALSQQEQRAFRRAAKRLDLRLCPSCDAPVQKNGGCNHIRCRCGADFQWSRAKPVARKSRTYRYAKQGAKAVGTAAVGVVAAPVVVAGAAVAGTAVLVYCVGTILAGGRLWDGTCR